MKQTTLNKFIDRSSSESDPADEEYVEEGPAVKKSETFYWTKVKAREQMSSEKQPVHIVNNDLDTLRRNKAYTKQCLPEAERFLFDVDDYKMNDPNLTPENYKLEPEELREHALLAIRLRREVVEKAKRLLGLAEDENDIDKEVMDQLPRSVKRSFKDRQGMVPAKISNKLHQEDFTPTLCRPRNLRGLNADTLQEIVRYVTELNWAHSDVALKFRISAALVGKIVRKGRGGHGLIAAVKEREASSRSRFRAVEAEV